MIDQELLTTEQQKKLLVMQQFMKAVDVNHFKIVSDEVLVDEPDYFSMLVKVTPRQDIPIEDGYITDQSSCIQIDLNEKNIAEIGYGDSGETMTLTMSNIYNFLYWDLATSPNTETDQVKELADLIARDKETIALLRSEVKDLKVKSKLFYVGQYKEDGKWEFQGIFNSEEKAIAACRDRNYFYDDVEINQELPDETILRSVNYPL